MDKVDYEVEIYEQSRKVFAKLMDEINDFYKTLPENMVLKTNINGVEFEVTKVSLINTHSTIPLSSLLLVCGEPDDGQDVRYFQPLVALNLPLFASPSPRSKHSVREILRSEVS